MGKPGEYNVRYPARGLPFFKVEDRQASDVKGELYANFSIAEQFYSNNGVPINEDKYYDFSARYETTMVGSDHYYYIKEGLTTARLNMYREPRFYANLGFDTGYWYGNGRTVDVGKGGDNETPWIMKMKAGEISGKCRHPLFEIRILCKKATNFETATSSTGALTIARYTFPIMRLADLYLLYAEALNESQENPTNEVYQYIDLVRQRAGLEGVIDSWSKYSNVPNKPLTKNGMRELFNRNECLNCVSKARDCGTSEDGNWGTFIITNPKLMECGRNSTEEYYKTITYNHLDFTIKQYLWPIREAELRKNINLIQNPYWE